ncbi:hypothetical protein [uncultured Pseudoteredinibacter sp.]|uniref:hypothetical protein n=1 Tax=uncultured Pseudoteredinibacter sp. TaxID=1641701 RepID=UPI00262CB4AF|nr:hypothetical protein [uncultured Pseudoteredinibacter sp.]
MKNLIVLATCAFAIPLMTEAASNTEGKLENPGPSVSSGIDVISGWKCGTESITVSIDGHDLGKAGIGTNREDTLDVCGHTATGFSLLYNYALLEEGEHKIDVYSDGELWHTSTFFTSRVSDTDFVRDLSHGETLFDFPLAGQTTSISWSEEKQNFVTDNTTTSTSKNTDAIQDSLSMPFSTVAKLGSTSQFSSTTVQLNDEDLAIVVEDSNSSPICSYQGEYTLNFSSIETNGTFDCKGSTGSYTGTVTLGTSDETILIYINHDDNDTAIYIGAR